MAKSKRARGAKSASVAMRPAKAAGAANKPKTRANSKQAEVLALLSARTG